MQDMFITQKAMYPFWVFADLHAGKIVGGPFVCFIGAHFEPGFVAQDIEVHKLAVGRMVSGAWKLAELKERPGAKIGYGYGKTPQEAFRKACYSSGYLKMQDTTK